MWRVLLLNCLLLNVHSTEIRDNMGAELLGDYNLLFVWPKPTQLVPNCTYARYRSLHFQDVPISCTCGRKEPNLAVLYQDTRFIPVGVLFDIVRNFDEATRALADSCQCQPLDKRVVALKINDDVMLQFEREDVLRHYLFGKRILSENKLRNIIKTLPGLEYEDGLLVCEEN